MNDEVILATEQANHTLPVMRKVRVQLDPSSVARFVKPHQRIAQLRRRAVVDA